MHSRRRFLQTALAAGSLPAMLSLSGCEALIDVLGDACPADPAESGGIDWTPDVLHPVSFGFKEYSVADGAPSLLRVYYPSHETFSDTHNILKSCLDRWPVVLFLHGQPPCLTIPAYYQRWRRIPTVLAKSGYVVVVPSYAAALPALDSPLIAFATSVIDWVRGTWEHAQWVDKRPQAIAVAGHSFGALLAAHVARARPDIGAYVGLSGAWEEFHSVNIDALSVLQAIDAPSLFMWAKDGFFENMDHGELWDQIPGTKYGVPHTGEHFDYLDRGSACGEPRGACTSIEAVSAELTALFLGRYFAQARSTSQIPVTLVPPTVVLTPKQQFYGGGDFTGLDAMKSNDSCTDIELRWVDGAEVGSRKLGP